MADNYLEKRMADYRSGKLGVPLRKNSATPDKGLLAFKMPELTVIVVGAADDAVSDMIVRLVNSGCHVAIVDTDRTVGAMTAQRTGALFYPVSGFSDGSLAAAINFIEDRWTVGIAAIIMTSSFAIHSPNPFSNLGYRVIQLVTGATEVSEQPSTIVRYDSRSAKRAAMMCAFLVLPENAGLSNATEFDLR